MKEKEEEIKTEEKVKKEGEEEMMKISKMTKLLLQCYQQTSSS